MEPIKRKRVTRVGSGAFSIYLPKKWIDSWAPDPDDDRQVDLHVINDSILISPAERTQSLERTAPSNAEAIGTLLLSAYVRGLDACTLTPQEDRFTNDAIASSRDLMRHLDERIVATCTPDAIGFRLDPGLPPPAADAGDILRVMGAKVREMLGLAAEAIAAAGHDPDRALHAMRLLVVTQREDVQRLLYQAVRSVARIELPMESVSDFQYLDLIASHLERMGGHCVRMVDVLLDEYGLAPGDLEYPRDHLLERIGPREPVQGPARAMVQAFRHDLDAIDGLLADALQAMASDDAPVLAGTIERARDAQQTIAAHVFQAVVHHWGEETDESNARAAFAMSRIASLLGDVLHALQSVARHAMVLTAAREESAA